VACRVPPTALCVLRGWLPTATVVLATPFSGDKRPAATRAGRTGKSNCPVWVCQLGRCRDPGLILSDEAGALAPEVRELCSCGGGP
jgi:hypothetical protein